MKRLVYIFLIIIAGSRLSLAASDEVFTLSEASTYLKLDIITVRKLFTNKEIPGREIEGDLRFSKSALLQWLENKPLKFAEPQHPKEEQQGHAQNKEALGKQADEADIEVIALRDQVAINKSGQLSGEMGLAYTKQQRYALAQDDLVSIKQRGIASTLTLRYGFGTDSQLRVSLPYQFTSNEVLASNGRQLFEESDSQYGATVFGVQKILVEEGLGYPGVLCGMEAGLGHEAEGSATCTFSKTYDPAIVFANIQYSYPLTNDTSWNVHGSIGVGLKLNDVIMIEGEMLGRYLADEKTEYGKIAATDDFGLRFGMNWRVHKNFFLEPFIQSYLNAEDNELAIGLNFIYQPQ